MADRILTPRRFAVPLLRMLAAGFAALWLGFAAQGQVIITNTSASFGSIQTALSQGVPVVVKLEFDATVTMGTILEITSDATLDGTGHTVVLQGGSANGIFLVDPGVTFKLINVTISGGQNTGVAGTNGATGSSNGFTGHGGGTGGTGGDIQGGAIYSYGTNICIGCIFVTNTATGGAGGAGGTGGNGSTTAGNGGNGGTGGKGFGGAIYNLGTLIVSNCTFSGNIAAGGAGGGGGTNGTGATAYPGNGGAGALGEGGAIYNQGWLTIVNSSFYDNLAGGGASQAGGTPNGNGNGAAGTAGPIALGGAIFNAGTNSALNSTFYQNFAVGGAGGNGGNASFGFFAGVGGNGGNAYGGSIYNGSNAMFHVTNCTFSAGSVIGGTNGAAGSGSSTNGTSSPGAVFGAQIANVGGSFYLKNTILASPTNAVNAYGLTTNSDQGNNISSDASPVFVNTNSHNSRNPGFLTGMIYSNGGPTLTIALRTGSPAIDAVYDTNSATQTDQRGAGRAGARPDIGAYEFNGSFTNLFTVSGTVTMGTNPFGGVTVTAGLTSSITDSNGNYSLLLSYPTSVQPQPSSYFSPSGRSVSSNSSGINFFATNVFTGFSVSTNTNSILTVTVTNFTLPNFNFVTQGTTNYLLSGATLPVWTNLFTNNSGSSGVFTYSFTITNTNSPQGFYRSIPAP